MKKRFWYQFWNPGIMWAWVNWGETFIHFICRKCSKSSHLASPGTFEWPNNYPRFWGCHGNIPGSATLCDLPSPSLYRLDMTIPPRDRILWDYADAEGRQTNGSKEVFKTRVSPADLPSVFTQKESPKTRGREGKGTKRINAGVQLFSCARQIPVDDVRDAGIHF